MFRPSWELGFDDPENPSSSEKIIRAVGGEPVATQAGPNVAASRLFWKEAIAVAMAGTNMKCEGSRRGFHGDAPVRSVIMSLDIYQERAGRAVKTELNSRFCISATTRSGHGDSRARPGDSRHLISVDRIVNVCRIGHYRSSYHAFQDMKVNVLSDFQQFSQRK